MAQSAVETHDVYSAQSTAAHKAVDSEFNLTAFSTFRACVMVVAVAAPIWGSILYILMR